MKSGIASRPREVDEWLKKQSLAHTEQVQDLAATVHAADGSIGEAIKWGRLTFTVGGNWHHWLCAVAISKGAVNLVFHKGALLDDPANLLRGEGRYLRQIPYDQAVAHPEAVTALVREAIARQTDMLDEGA
jgi:hypothetical protein